MCAGDPATDLSAAWILLPAQAAKRFFNAYEDVDEATIARARGWALLRALGLIGIGQKGRLCLPGGKATWEPAGLRRLNGSWLQADHVRTSPCWRSIRSSARSGSSHRPGSGPSAGHARFAAHNVLSDLVYRGGLRQSGN